MRAALPICQAMNVILSRKKCAGTVLARRDTCDGECPTCDPTITRGYLLRRRTESRMWRQRTANYLKSFGRGESHSRHGGCTSSHCGSTAGDSHDHGGNPCDSWCLDN